jgi:hypothetical protein
MCHSQPYADLLSASSLLGPVAYASGRDVESWARRIVPANSNMFPMREPGLLWGSRDRQAGSWSSRLISEYI